MHICAQVGALLRKQIPARPPNPLPDNSLEFYDSGDDSSDSGLEDILGVGHSTCRAACMQVLTEHACKKGHGGQVGRARMQVQRMHVYIYRQTVSEGSGASGSRACGSRDVPSSSQLLSMHALKIPISWHGVHACLHL